jgi:hypothetical protein
MIVLVMSKSDIFVTSYHSLKKVKRLSSTAFSLLTITILAMLSWRFGQEQEVP